MNLIHAAIIMIKNFNVQKYKHHLLLHLVVFIWGWTGIIGKLISIHAVPLVWVRIWLTVIFIGSAIIFTKESILIPKRQVLKLILVGFLIALHWIFFYRTIQISTVSIAVICLSTSTFFNAVLTPILFKEKTHFYQYAIGILVMFAIAYIFNYQPGYENAIIMGVVSAFFSAAFTTINGKISKDFSPLTFSFYELLGGVVMITPFIIFNEEYANSFIATTSKDWIWLIVLASVCTAFPFIATAKVLRYINSFTVVLAINLEPVYTIIFAYLIFGDAEKMNYQFYIGTAVILFTLFINAYLKKRYENLLEN